MRESRYFKIVYHLLDRGACTAQEMAEKFDVSIRTIYRDIDALSEAGIPVYAAKGRKGGIYLLNDLGGEKALLSDKEKQDIMTALQDINATGYMDYDETLKQAAELFHTGAVSRRAASPWKKKASRGGDSKRRFDHIKLRFSKEAGNRVYDEFDRAQVEEQENGDLLVLAWMPEDAWLTGFLLSFGAQVEIIEPVCLRRVIAEQAMLIYEKNKDT